VDINTQEVRTTAITIRQALGVLATDWRAWIGGILGVGAVFLMALALVAAGERDPDPVPRDAQHTGALLQQLSRLSAMTSVGINRSKFLDMFGDTVFLNNEFESSGEIDVVPFSVIKELRGAIEDYQFVKRAWDYGSMSESDLRYDLEWRSFFSDAWKRYELLLAKIGHVENPMDSEYAIDNFAPDFVKAGFTSASGHASKARAAYQQWKTDTK